jgi:hypothetical protein
MQIKRIFLDLDDVLNNFSVHCLQCLGCDIKDYSEYPKECKYDIHSAAIWLNPKLKIQKEKFWWSIPREVWTECPKSIEFDELIRLSTLAVGRANIYVLTRPTQNPECALGKVVWIKKFLPEWLHEQYLIGAPKYVCAKQGNLLIDDLENNCEDFAHNGGKAILIPRPWNKLYYINDTLEYLQWQFNYSFGRYGI